MYDDFSLMSGLFTSIDSMPQWALWIAHINPVTYFIEVMRMVVLKGSGFKDVTHQLLVISIMAVLLMAEPFKIIEKLVN